MGRLPEGLSEREAAERLRNYGENRLQGKKKRGALATLGAQFRDALILILLGATLVSLLMGEITEAITISAIVTLNALIGFFQEYRTEKTLEKLGELAAPEARVIRNGTEQSIPASQVVPGDLALLRAGDRVPADGEILSAVALSCDESMLSGESLSVEKSEGAAAYMGTLITAGHGTMRVQATGNATEMGKIAGMLGEVKPQPTPLQQKLAQLSRWIGIGCLAVCALVTLFGVLRGEAFMEMLLAGISLAVAAVPEGLPAIVTVALALSVGRMVKRHALVRQLHAVETLGCATVICSDKTGTLTENRMTVLRLYTPDRRYDVTPAGEIAGAPHPTPALERIFTISAVCSSASVQALRGFGKSRLEIRGEPTEAALARVAAEAGITRETAKLSVEREFPFDSVRKRMSVLARGEDGCFLLCKGATDLLLPRCDRVLTETGIAPLDGNWRRKISAQNEAMAKDALRVLAFAYREGEAIEEEHLIFAGLAGLSDPPRKEAFEAVRVCKRAGIRPIMITGDHAETARAIGAQLGILQEGQRALTGGELDQMSDAELDHALPEIAVFARVSPSHKLRVVQALRRRGEVVAMTGDGVNDAPALKEADIGVAMGKGGTDVAKEAAGVILLDDNFATLVTAVEEGRVIYANIRKFIRYLLACNLGEVLTMFAAMLLGLPSPLTPIQILLVNLVTDGLPAIALGLEKAEEDCMNRPPRGVKDSVFSDGLAKRIALRGVLIGATTLGVFWALWHSGAPLLLARTGALVTLILAQLIHVFECKSETHDLLHCRPLSNPALLGAVLVSAGVMLASVYTRALGAVFATAPLGLHVWVLIGSACAFAPAANALLLGRKGKFFKNRA